MNPNPRITLAMTPVEGAVALADGNPGAATVVGQLLNDPMGLIDLCHLDDMGIYGSQIWVAYKRVCHSDIELFRSKIRERTLRQELQKEKDGYAAY